MMKTADSEASGAVSSSLKRAGDFTSAEGKESSAAGLQAEEPPQKRSKKRVRYAVLLAYQGKNYFGMQVQKNTSTIEGCLLDAMHRYGLITAEDKERPQLFFFQRAARTDRAVSAVRQVCSMMLNFDVNLPIEGPSALNQLLPEDIRVMGIRRATRTFHAQKDCDCRTYSYTLPTYAFANVDELTTNAYRIDDKTVEEINDLMKVFVGTHNFYNYTSKREFKDRSCARYIIDFKCGPKQLYNNDFTGAEIEFITIFIKGQSFMLHQIRKMIGMIIAIIRGFSYKSDIQRSFERARMDVPKAPGLGLLLEKLHYEWYDRKFSSSHETLDDWGEEIEAKIKQARQDLIISEILKQEVLSQSMMMWLTDLPKHDFISLPENEESAPSPIATAAFAAKSAEETSEQDVASSPTVGSAVIGPTDNETGASVGANATETEISINVSSGPAVEGENSAAENVDEPSKVAVEARASL